MKKFFKKAAIILSIMAVCTLAFTAYILYGKGYSFDRTVDTVFTPRQAISTVSAREISANATAAPGGAALGIVLTSDAMIGISITLVGAAAALWFLVVILPGKKAKEAGKGDH